MPEIGSHVILARLVTLGHHHDAAHAAARAPALGATQQPAQPEPPERGKPLERHHRHG